MTYAGLTISDKPALLDAKARGAEWVARDSEDQANELMAYYCKPKKHSELGAWLVDQDDILRSSIFLFVNDMLFVQWSDAEPVNIDLAIAQITEMEKNQAIKAVEGAVSAEQVCDNINDIPAADVEPVVRGEWTMLTADLTDWSRETYVHWLKCSLCGKAVPLRSKSKFCPHCGAHMVERQCAMPFKTQSVEEEKKACADYFERAERSGSGE